METPELEALTRRHRTINAQIAELSEEAAEIRRRIRDTHDPGFRHTVDGSPVTIGIRRKFDLAAAVKLLTDDVLALCRPDGYDPKKVKSFLAPVLLDSVMVPDSVDVKLG